MLSFVITRRHVLNNLPLSLSPGSAVLLVKVGIGFILLLFSKEVIFLVRVKIPDKEIEISLAAQIFSSVKVYLIVSDLIILPVFSIPL